MNRASRPEWLAAELLLAVALRHHLWPLAPVEHQGEVSKLLGALLALVFLRVIWELAPRSRWLASVLALGAWYQLQAVLCTWWWLAVGPWQIAPGRGMCSARMDFDLGAVGLMALSVLVWRFAPVIFGYSNNSKDARQ